MVSPSVKRARGEVATVVAVCVVLVLGIIAVGLHTATGYRIDHRLTYVVGGRNGFFDRVHLLTSWVRVRNLAGLAFALFLAGVAWRRPRAAIAAPTILLGASVLTQLLKVTVGRDQLPSGHATAGLGLALAVVVLSSPRWRLVGVALATAVGGVMAQAAIFSMRHAPGDVFASILTTAAFAAVILAFVSLLPWVSASDRSPWPSQRQVWRTLLLTNLIVAIGLLLFGVSYSGRRRDLLLMWPTHGGYALGVTLAVWWTDRLTRTFVDYSGRLSRRSASSAAATRRANPGHLAAPRAGD